MKIVTIVGARPQFIKAGAISRSIQKFKKNGIREVLVHTGQHYDYLMDKIFFEELDLPKPDYHLGVGSGSHGRQTGMMLERIESVLRKEKPELVIVYGDTNSTLSGALSAAKLNIPIAHIEAGLRSYNRSMPEEINRILTDQLATFLFCPTKQSLRNLIKEGIKDGGATIVKQVGDVMYDSILYYSNQAEKRSTILKDLNLIAHYSSPFTSNYYLATLHRAENTDHPERLRSILFALSEIGKNRPVIFPLHPRTRKMMEVFKLWSKRWRIKFIEPVSYLNILKLEKNARAIFTDSGGIQKEAYWFKVPCLTLREETEWVETVKSGWNVLVGAKPEIIIREIMKLEERGLLEKRLLNRLKHPDLFGDGKASEKVVKTLISK